MSGPVGWPDWEPDAEDGWHTAEDGLREEVKRLQKLLEKEKKKRKPAAKAATAAKKVPKAAATAKKAALTTPPKISREEVYGVIDGERDYQDERAKGWAHQGAPSVAQELLMAEKYLADAKAAWVTESGDTAALKKLVCVAAISVRCFEHHGAPAPH